MHFSKRGLSYDVEIQMYNLLQFSSTKFQLWLQLESIRLSLLRTHKEKLRNKIYKNKNIINSIICSKLKEYCNNNRCPIFWIANIYFENFTFVERKQ